MLDEEIVAALRRGDGAAFSELYERYAGRGLRYARALLSNQADAEEAVQEAFCRLLEPLRSGVPASNGRSFSALFFRTLRNLSIDALRRGPHRRHLSLEAVPEPARPAADVSEGELLSTRIRQGLARLPEQQRDALELRVSGGLSYDEIAGALECTRAQVRTWIFRARRQLSRELNQPDERREKATWIDVNNTPNR